MRICVSVMDAMLLLVGRTHMLAPVVSSVLPTIVWVSASHTG